MPVLVASYACSGCRYLMCENDDQVKLLLETVQMSVSSCMQHPELPTLRPQMVGRLMAAHHSSRVSVCPPIQYILNARLLPAVH